MHKLLCALSLGACLQLTPVAHADPFTQTFYLISNSGGSGGYGNFTLNVAPPATGQVVYDYDPGYFITALTVYPRVGFSFTQANSLADLVIFNDGVLTDLDFVLERGNGSAGYQNFFSTSPSLTYSDSYNTTDPLTHRPNVVTDSGIISLTPAAVNATPEPSSLVLLGTGLLAGVGLVRRRCLPKGSSMRKLLFVLAVILPLQITATAHATPFTQTFYLVSNSGGSGGYGNFTLNVAPPATGQVVYDYDPGYFITALSVYPSVGFSFMLAQSVPNLIIYNDGVLTSLQTHYNVGGGTGTDLFVSSFLVYQEQSCLIPRPGTVNCTNDAGTISLTPAAPNATPEPSSLILLGTGLMATCGVLRRRLLPDPNRAARSA